MKFLNRIISALQEENKDLSHFALVLPGKRPVVFIKKILQEKKYSGMLPDFYTIEELIGEIASKIEIKGIALWLFAYNVYHQLYGDEDFSSFLKWFPTLQKDWDDILKFAGDDAKVLQYMLDEERIKNWGAKLGEETAFARNLNFWRRMGVFLPKLKSELHRKGWATAGMLHQEAKQNTAIFVGSTDRKWVFCGFNAFTPTEEFLVKSLLQWDKARCFFQADRYYMEDVRQESGKFLREHRLWKEFNDSRAFEWIDDDFAKPKNINLYEVSGNVTQTKILPAIFRENQLEKGTDTAVILLDENLLPASLDALSSHTALNITMGFPLKNLAFSNAVKKLFYLHKQQEKKEGAYYYSDVLTVLQSLPNGEEEKKIIENIKNQIRSRNLVYLSKSRLAELLAGLWYRDLFEKPQNPDAFLKTVLQYCEKAKHQPLDDIQFENISHFEKSFKIIRNQLSGYDFEMKMETLEVLVNQLVNTETIDFEGEPLEGLQVMGLLETRLLNFKNIILLSVNEGKLPLGNTQNTYLPFDVRRIHNLHTFLENDSIYAYHFYRLLQGAENIHLLYNSLSSGVNTGEKSRFITQIEMESKHEIKEIIVENASMPISSEPMMIEKTPAVIQKLEEWKKRVSASDLTSYLYDPVQFYYKAVLKVVASDEVEEELSQRNYGNIVHFALQDIYQKEIGKFLTENALAAAISNLPQHIDAAIAKLQHEPGFYATGMNYIHKSIASRVIESILKYDIDLLENGNQIEIVGIEHRIEDIPFPISDQEEVRFYGSIDRVDRLNGQLRVIDYKTSKGKNLTAKFTGNEETLFTDEKFKQALQLSIYLYALQHDPKMSHESPVAGIWSFADVNAGVKPLNFVDGDLGTAMMSVKTLINEILNPEMPFTETRKPDFDFA